MGLIFICSMPAVYFPGLVHKMSRACSGADSLLNFQSDDVIYGVRQ